VGGVYEALCGDLHVYNCSKMSFPFFASLPSHPPPPFSSIPIAILHLNFKTIKSNQYPKRWCAVHTKMTPVKPSPLALQPLKLRRSVSQLPPAPRNGSPMPQLQLAPCATFLSPCSDAATTAGLSLCAVLFVLWCARGRGEGWGGLKLKYNCSHHYRHSHLISIPTTVIPSITHHYHHHCPPPHQQLRRCGV
jgi:hypothetical protein